MPLDWSQQFLRSPRGKLIAQLRRGPATVEQLAAAVGLTPNGVRAHLATLERDGWIHSGGIRRQQGPGKPAALYVLSDGAEPLLSAAYRPLLVGLVDALARSERPARLRGFFRTAGKRLAAQIGEAGKGGPAERATRLLEALGATVEVKKGRKGNFELLGLGCPVAEVVAVAPQACQAMSTLLAEALDARVVECCDRSGSPRCRFAVTPRA
ncbi:MAG TPA: ArsR family transcriptional regulator [Gemmatimonadales bacterium]|nr:ArsR family transcriptional regulator [Gemmatimonadales bacterium]